MRKESIKLLVRIAICLFDIWGMLFPLIRAQLGSSLSDVLLGMVITVFIMYFVDLIQSFRVKDDAPKKTEAEA